MNKKNFNNTNNRSELTFPNEYLYGGYFEDKNKEILKCEYIVEYPKHIVLNLIRNKDKNKSSQLRKYYDYIVRIKDTLKYDNQIFNKVHVEINRLDYYVSYAESRGKVSRYFVDFIKKNLKNIKTKEDFFAFLKHFEAIIAYLPKEK